MYLLSNVYGVTLNLEKHRNNSKGGFLNELEKYSFTFKHEQ